VGEGCRVIFRYLPRHINAVKSHEHGMADVVKNG
jgi:hypothetical protein